MKKEQEENNNRQEKENPKEDKIDEIAELKSLLQRLQADFENYKRRTESEKQNLVKCANIDMIKEILPLLDNFELSIKNIPTIDKSENDSDQETKKYLNTSVGVFKGFEMLYGQMLDILAKHGLKAITAKSGEKFNPELHEVVLTEDSDKPSGTIIEDMQKGYMINDKVIRHSKVKVSK